MSSPKENKDRKWISGKDSAEHHSSIIGHLKMKHPNKGQHIFSGNTIFNQNYFLFNIYLRDIFEILTRQSPLTDSQPLTRCHCWNIARIVNAVQCDSLLLWCNKDCHLVCQGMSPHFSDVNIQRSQVSRASRSAQVPRIKSTSWTWRGGLKLHEVPTTDSSQVCRVQVQVQRGKAELDEVYLS